MYALSSGRSIQITSITQTTKESQQQGLFHPSEYTTTRAHQIRRQRKLFTTRQQDGTITYPRFDPPSLHDIFYGNWLCPTFSECVLPISWSWWGNYWSYHEHLSVYLISCWPDLGPHHGQGPATFSYPVHHIDNVYDRATYCLSNGRTPSYHGYGLHDLAIQYPCQAIDRFLGYDALK